MGTRRRRQPASQLVSIKLPPSLAAKVARLAKKRRTTRSAVIREAIEALTERRPGSAAEHAADLYGSVSAPPDLSTNPRYMEGFGE